MVIADANGEHELGYVLDRYFNRVLAKNEKDYEYFRTEKIEEGLKLNAPWRRLIDNDWHLRLWECSDRDIDKLNAVGK